MPRATLMLPLLFCGLSCSLLRGQASSGNTLAGLLDKTESNVSLTAHGSPFHAEMKIVGAKAQPQYAASITVDWASATKYRIELRSTTFHQIKTVDADHVQDQTEGDFYPGWLHTFVVALLDPMSVKPLLFAKAATLNASRRSNGSTTQVCVDRNDRPGGITDDMTWSGVCVTPDALLTHVHTFTAWMDLSDYKSFSGKKIARGYSTSTGSYEEITGKLTSLRPLTATEIDAIQVTKETPKDHRIGFAFISTKEEQARLESAKPFDWPTMREGKTNGYMIVHAVTDVTGQVRETSKHNSDNPGMEEAGRQAALGYKFKPMLVDGVPVQMEMPLVLHFTTKIADPLPVLKGADLLQQIKGCHAELVYNPKIDANTTPTHISVNEEGKLTGEGFGPKVDPGNPAVVVTLAAETNSGRPSGLIFDCQFAPLTRNGVITYYHGDLLVVQSK